MKTLSNVWFLAQQALPLSGDKAGEIKFNQLYYLQAEDKPFLSYWVKQKGDKYTSKDIQNEMMKVMALQVLWEIAAEIRSTDFFTVMVDEVTLQTFHSLYCAYAGCKVTWNVTTISSDSIHLTLPTQI